MTDLTIKDKEFLRTKWNQTWNRCRDSVDKSEQTLQDYVRELAEIADQQIDAGILNIKKNDISSYLNKEFLKEGRDVVRSIQLALTPEYKHSGTNFENETLRELHWITIETSNPTLANPRTYLSCPVSTMS